MPQTIELLTEVSSFPEKTSLIILNEVRLKILHIFFLHCNLYGQLRHALLDRVSTYCQPTVNVFLYGNTDLTDVENAELFSAVQDNILKTKRFC